MLHLQNISFEIGGNYLFKNIDWFIKPKERIALIGKNGAGKSTLLKLITGQYELREGNINKQGDLKIGYLSQDMISEDNDRTVLETARQAFKQVIKLQETMDELLVLVESDPSEENLHKLGDAQEEFGRLDGYTIESKCGEILEGLGFKTADLDRPLHEFSGGWRMRVILAKMLLEQPDLMLMDEPTNHLDLPSIEWLEGYLSTFAGSVVIVSHDREFLNKLTSKTAELSNQQLYLWEGNYDFYLTAKVERDELLERKLENQKQFIKDQEKFINRFRYKASKAKAVQSRLKMLDKLDTIEEIPQENAKIKMDFQVAKRSGKVVMKLEDIHKSFGDQELFDQVDIEIERGDKIALIGANGTGKSTFLRIIADTEEFDGERIEGHNVEPSSYAQHQLETLSLKDQILDELKHAAPSRSETELRNLLGCFLFTGDDVFKTIKVLSGGEKARVALSKCLVSEANFLLLDEPTNHLDIDSIEILIEALANYEGTLIFVSHNRYFISKLANKVWWIEDKKVKSYPGTYDEYLQRASKVKSNTMDEAKKPEKVKKEKNNWRQDDSLQQELRKLKQQHTNVEQKISTLHKKKQEIEDQLAKSAGLDQQDIIELGRSLSEIQEEIEPHLTKSEQLQDQILDLEIRMEE